MDNNVSTKNCVAKKIKKREGILEGNSYNNFTILGNYQLLYSINIVTLMTAILLFKYEIYIYTQAYKHLDLTHFYLL